MPQTLFHRPLQDLLGPLLNSGEMVLDRLKELAFGHEPNRAQIQFSVVPYAFRVSAEDSR
jgi:hypothetical protein